MPLTGFEPVIAPHATVLVLGSMPGNPSLRVQQYYGNPQNLFWPFMEEIHGVPRALPYAERLLALQAARVALWDVLHKCERAGSLDAAIIPASEEPNDFDSLLTTYPTIKRICFNGAKAVAAFARHVMPTLDRARIEHLTLIRLPSTSPANRAIPTANKLEQWRTALLE